jgi:hypothetical protein
MAPLAPLAPLNTQNYRHLPVYAAILGFLASTFQLFSLAGWSFLDDIPAHAHAKIEFREPPPTKNALTWIFSIVSAFCGVLGALGLGKRISDSAGLDVGRVTWWTTSAFTAQAVFGLILCAWYADKVGELPEYRRFGEGFFSALEGAVLALATALMLALDYFWTPEFANSGSGLSWTQRRVVWYTLAVTVYSSLLALMFSLLEGWSYRSATFFTLTTLTTIGFGAPPHVPTNPLSRVLVMFSAGIGIAMVAGTVRSISEVIDEGLQEGVKLRWRRRRAGEYRKLDSGTASNSWITRWSRAARQVLSRRGIHPDRTVNEDRDLEMGSPTVASPREPAVSLDSLTPNFRKRFYLSLFSMAIFWTLSSVTFHFTEPGWTLFDAFYFTFISFTTIGYGDLTPTSSGSLAAFNLFVLVGIGVLTHFANAVTQLIRATTDPEGVARKLLGEVLPDGKSSEVDELEEMDESIERE